MPGTAGNLSVTLGRDPLRLAVTASGLDKGELTAGDIVIIDGRRCRSARRGRIGQAPLGRGRAARAHRGVTGAGAVIHVHALAAVTAAHLWPDGVVLRDLEMLKGIGHSAHDEEVVDPGRAELPGHGGAR